MSRLAVNPATRENQSVNASVKNSQGIITTCNNNNLLRIEGGRGLTSTEDSVDSPARPIRKRNIEREPESFLITAQNNAVKTNRIKARTDKMQQQI